MGGDEAIRGKIVNTCRSMNQSGLVPGTAGNVSVRWKDGMLVTPSGIPHDIIKPPDIVYIPFDRPKNSGTIKPSSEWRLHKDILISRSEIFAVVHTHSVFATAMATLRLSIPAHHYMVAAAGGKDIPCAAYATFGTQVLSDNARIALDGRLACLLANHGVIALGSDLDSALRLANEVENLAKQYVIARQIGRPVLLPDDEMDRVLGKFKSYGKGL